MLQIKKKKKWVKPAVPSNCADLAFGLSCHAAGTVHWRDQDATVPEGL